MGCYYHPAVPTAVLCRDCGHEICTHCAVDSLCPGCRLGQAMKGAAQRQPVLTAIKGGSNGNGARTQTDPRPTFTATAQTAAPPRAGVTVVEAPPTPEDRLLAALCYPLWPVAMIVLFLQSQRSKFLRFNVVQSLAVNALGVGLYAIYAATSHFPVIGWQSALVLPFAMPIWFFIDLYLGVKAYGGESVKVPIAAELASKYAA
ncbi:MAG TPA: hypothetical protein VFO25_11380 [Candidatus Eremiobacteraceae bacterium]|nr:hypothetical protein [Candidatus Eremiobacteraceae bacterium]